MFAREEEDLTHGGGSGSVGVPAEAAAADVVGQGHGVIHDIPLACTHGGTVERRSAGGVGSAWNEVNIRLGGEGVRRVVSGSGEDACVAIGNTGIQAEITLEDVADAVDFGAEDGAGVGSVTGTERITEDAQTALDGGGEIDNETWLGEASGVGGGQSEGGDAGL